MSPRLLIPSIVLLAAGLASGCNRQNDTTPPADADTALDQSATMGGTTQQQFGESQQALGDGVAGTSTAATVDQYGPTGGTNAAGDASADTSAGGAAGAVTGTSGTGLSGSTSTTGRDAAVPSGNAAGSPLRGSGSGS